MTDDLRIADRMLPQPDGVSQEYWDGLGRGELRVQRCSACEHTQFYPRALCEACAGDVEWITATGRGDVHTFTVVRANPIEPFRSLVPYVLAIVRLAEGPQMMTNIIDCDPEDVFIGMPVELAPVEADGVTLPFWKPKTDA